MTRSSFKSVPVSIVGPSAEHRDQSYSGQVTMNYLVEGHQTGSHQGLLTGRPGAKGFATITGSNPRGIYERLGGVVYKISDTTLYSVTSLGVETSIGTIAGTGRCNFADDGTNLIIATGTRWYQYDGTALIEFTSPTTSTGLSLGQGNSVTFIGGFAVYDVAGGKFYVSDFGDPDGFQNNNFATAESVGDDLIRVLEFKERVYMFGTQSIETWTKGTGNPPLQQNLGGTMVVGLGDVHSVAKSVNFVYFRANDGLVYRFSSNQPVNVTSGFMAQKFRDYNLGNAVAYTYNLDGVYYYVISFPTDNKTWFFSEKSGELSPGVNDWAQLSTGTDQDRFIGEMYVRAFGRDLVEKKNNGDILELDFNTFTDDGETILRIRETPPIHGGLLGQEGGRLEMSWLEVVMKKGVGTQSGTGVDPRLYFQGTFDGSDSYSNESEVEIGRLGDSTIKVKWYHAQSFYEAAFRTIGYDPVLYSIHSASIGLKFVGE